MVTINQIKEFLQEITLDDLKNKPELLEGLKSIQVIINDFLRMINPKGFPISKELR